MGYWLGTAGASAFKPRDKRAIAMMGDGGFWHNGLTSGIGNAVFNQDDNLTIIVDNGYSAAPGGQEILSSKAANPSGRTTNPIVKELPGIAAPSAKTLPRRHDAARMRGRTRS